jgi:TfoX/Sxy family transcriptional regulator of competence genes
MLDSGDNQLNREAVMGSSQATVDFILEQIQAAGVVSARKMFGEYGLYCDGKFMAVVCDDRLYIKPTDAGRAFIGDVDEAPPYQGAKNYFHISGEKWDNSEWLSELIKVTTRELPLPKKK